MTPKHDFYVVIFYIYIYIFNVHAHAVQSNVFYPLLQLSLRSPPLVNARQTSDQQLHVVPWRHPVVTP